MFNMTVINLLQWSLLFYFLISILFDSSFCLYTALLNFVIIINIIINVASLISLLPLICCFDESVNEVVQKSGYLWKHLEIS